MKISVLQFELLATVERIYGPLVTLMVNAAGEKAAKDWTIADTKRYGTEVEEIIKDTWGD